MHQLGKTKDLHKYNLKFFWCKKLNIFLWVVISVGPLSSNQSLRTEFFHLWHLYQASWELGEKMTALKALAWKTFLLTLLFHYLSIWLQGGRDIASNLQLHAMEGDKLTVLLWSTSGHHWPAEYTPPSFPPPPQGKQPTSLSSKSRFTGWCTALLVGVDVVPFALAVVQVRGHFHFQRSFSFSLWPLNICAFSATKRVPFFLSTSHANTRLNYEDEFINGLAYLSKIIPTYFNLWLFAFKRIY